MNFTGEEVRHVGTDSEGDSLVGGAADSAASVARTLNGGAGLVRFLGQPAQQRGKVLEVARVQRYLQTKGRRGDQAVH